MKHRLEQANPGGDGNGGGGGGDASNAAWYGDISSAPQDFRDWVGNKGFKDARTALESNFNLEKLIGFEKAGRTVVLPKDENDAEGRKAYHAKIGVPESADKYELPLPDGDNGEFGKIASGWFHQAGVPKGAAQAISKAWNEHIAGIVAKEQAEALAQSKQQLDSLKTEWGGEFEKNSELARRFLRASGWDEAKMRQYEETFGTAAMLKDFHAWGSQFAEPALAGNPNGGDSNFRGTPAQARADVDEARGKYMSGTITKEAFEALQNRLAPIAAKTS